MTGGPQLTRRQREIAALVARGFTRDEIAKRLHIGSETVKTHVRKAAERIVGEGRPKEKLIWFVRLSEDGAE